MNEPAPKHDTPPEPQSTTSEKFPIRKSQEEFVEDLAVPSIDKSEYQGKVGPRHADAGTDAGGSEA